MIFVTADAVRICADTDNVAKNNETQRMCEEEPCKSQVYWLRKTACTGLAAHLALQEILAIEHTQTYLKSVNSEKNVEWTAYGPDLLATHRDASGKWR